MEDSPSKRRKLTPELSVAVDASNTNIEPAGRDERTLTPGRASYMSPTKSTLARYNPSFLPRPKSAGNGDQRPGEEAALGGGQHTASSPRRLNAVPLRPTTPSERPPPPARLSASPIRAGSASPRRISAIGGALSSPARRRSRTPGRRSEPPPLPSARLDYNAPKFAPPVIPETMEDAADTQLSLELEATIEEAATQAQASEGRIPALIDEEREPELPPTPEHLGLKPMPSPPKGLMSSSPSARKSKRKAHKSSPLKPRSAPAPVPSLQEESVIQEMEETPQDARRFVEPEKTDTPEEIERKETLKRLTRQLEAIQADEVVLAAAVTAVRNDKRLENLEELIPIITSANPTHKPLPPPPKPLPLSKKLSFFLPFSRRRRPVKELPKEPDVPLPSYSPIEVEDPLPQLRAFHPLAVTSSQSMVETASRTGQLLLQRDLHLASPASLLSAHLRITINTEEDSIHSLAIQQLSPWAHQELGSWIQAQTREGDVSTIGWACGRYWDLSVVRARVWARCCEKYPQLVPETVRKLEATAPAIGEHVQDQDGSIMAGTSRAELRAHLGRQTLRCQRDGATVIFKWKIEFDWTGEVQSKLGVETAFPRTWNEADERKSLAKVPKVFNRLVKERGVSEAIRIVVSVIWP